MAQTTDQPEVRACTPQQAERGPRPAASALTTAFMVAGLLATIYGQFSEALTAEGKGLISLVQVLLLLGFSVPVGFAMLLSGTLGIAGVTGWAVATSSIKAIPYGASASWSMSVLPMFVLMGVLLWRSGATDHAYRAAQLWVGKMPGGLAITTNAAGAGLAAVSGSTIGIAYALTRIGVPEMLRAGYAPRLAAGSVLVSGLAGQLIPPSVMMVVYAGVAGTPVGPQLMAGVIPGLILVLGFGLVMWAIGVFRPNWAPRSNVGAPSMRQRLLVTLRAWPIPVLMLVVVCGIFFGVFTSTEAGAFGALGAALITLISNRPSAFAGVLGRALVDAASATAAIMLLLIGAGMIGRLMALSGVGALFTDVVSNLGLGRAGLLLALMVLFLLMGMALESLTIMFIMVPLLVPVLIAYDVSLIWFGAFIVLSAELAVITPPVGILAFIVHRVVQDPEIRGATKISLGDVFIGGMYFAPVAVLVLILMILVPGVAEWLPNATSVK